MFALRISIAGVENLDCYPCEPRLRSANLHRYACEPSLPGLRTSIPRPTKSIVCRLRAKSLRLTVCCAADAIRRGRSRVSRRRSHVPAQAKPDLARRRVGARRSFAQNGEPSNSHTGALKARAGALNAMSADKGWLTSVGRQSHGTVNLRLLSRTVVVLLSRGGTTRVAR